MRPLSPDDAAALHAGYGDDATMRWWSTPPHADLAETRAYLADNEPDDKAGEDAWQGWTVLAGDTPIGTLSAGNRRQGVFEIGYLLVPTALGRGYGAEMVSRLIDLIFTEGEAHRVYADVDPDNAASIALLERLGFTREGRLREAWDSHIGRRDALIFGLLKREWRASSSAASRARAVASTARPAPHRAPR